MGRVLRYFDLNKRTTGRQKVKKAVKPLENRVEINGVRKISWWEQILMYFCTLIGVVFSSAVMQYKSGEDVQLNLTVTTVLLSAVIALIVIPVVFEKLSIKPNAPILFRLGLFVQHGVFWSVLLSSIGKALAG